PADPVAVWRDGLGPARAYPCAPDPARVGQLLLPVLIALVGLVLLVAGGCGVGALVEPDVAVGDCGSRSAAAGVRSAASRSIGSPWAWFGHLLPGRAGRARAIAARRCAPTRS